MKVFKGRPGKSGNVINFLHYGMVKGISYFKAGREEFIERSKRRNEVLLLMKCRVLSKTSKQ